MNLSVQSDLACHHDSIDIPRTYDFKSSQYCGRDRNIKAGTFFLHIRRCEINSDSLWWKLIAVILKCCTYSVLGFFYLSGWKSYHYKGRKSVTYICFNLDRTYFYP